ncbi:MAG: hypothetical protein HY071_01580 [Chloroflexi bacterium]|nr:hypothetical protein [Chloroflexota bacterium]
MILLGFIALATLAATGTKQLRYSAAAFLLVALAATWISTGVASLAQVAVTGCSGLVAAALLFVAASDARYGEEPGWRVWLATAFAATATSAGFAALRTVSAETPQLPLFGGDPTGVTVQVAAFWLLASGAAILLTARTAVRMSLGAVLMITGVQLLVRLVTGSSLALTLLFAWLEVVVALVGAFLIINERAAIDL